MTEQGRPRLTDTFLEFSRTCGEFALLQIGRKELKKIAPKGDGAPVMVIPGFLADDFIYKPLRTFLDDVGYKSYKWEGGTNMGWNDKLAAHVERQITNVFNENAGRKLRLVGHSLGGIYAREIARELPEMVEKVITLGSPFGGAKRDDTATPILKKVFDYVDAGGSLLENEEIVDRLIVPPPVPTTSVYTRKDGAVYWKSCLNPEPQEGEKSENQEVYASHVGLAVNPMAFLVVADRLAQDTDDWKPFDRKAYHSMLLPAKQAHEGHLPEHPGMVSGQGKKLIFKYDMFKA